MKALAANLRYYRKRSNYTQLQLANLVGIHKNYISAIERGTTEPSHNLIDRLCDALGIDEITLRFGGEAKARGLDEQLLAAEVADVREGEHFDLVVLIRNWKKEHRGH